MSATADFRRFPATNGADRVRRRHHDAKVNKLVYWDESGVGNISDWQPTRFRTRLFWESRRAPLRILKLSNAERNRGQ